MHMIISIFYSKWNVKHGSPVTPRYICMEWRLLVCTLAGFCWISFNIWPEMKLACAPWSVITLVSISPSANYDLNCAESWTNVFLLHAKLYYLLQFVHSGMVSSPWNVLVWIWPLCSYLIYSIGSGDPFPWDLLSECKHNSAPPGFWFLLMPHVSVSGYLLLLWCLGKCNSYLNLSFLKVLLLFVFCISFSFSFCPFCTSVYFIWSFSSWFAILLINLSKFKWWKLSFLLRHITSITLQCDWWGFSPLRMSVIGICVSNTCQ